MPKKKRKRSNKRRSSGASSRSGGGSRSDGARQGRQSAGTGGGPRKTGAGALRPADELPSIDNIVRTVLKGGRELLDVDDPLDAEHWASQMLGIFYKAPVPLEAREELERSLPPAIVSGAEDMRNEAGLAILTTLAAVTDDELGARAAADRMKKRGVPEPRWAGDIGRPESLDCWAAVDPFGDQIGYYFTFRYPGRSQHLLMALYDENLGGIIKDAFVAPLKDDAEVPEMLNADPDVEVREADPAEAAAHIAAAIATGDVFIDNDWTEEFRHNRALVLARTRLFPQVELPESPSPSPDEDEQEALIKEFLASPLAPPGEEILPIVDQCVISRCIFGDGDPLRWSPIVVELFLLDYLPRKATLSFAQIRALPDVLKAWVRFALTRRGLEERLIAETEEAVDRYAPEFRRAMTDQESFGPAKSLSNAMRADGVELTDKQAVADWIAAFNERPEEERARLLGPLPGIDD
jgi:hypothetical protein